jgi:cation diffusion facilitator CzcD-associated flavoprotein CzcO
MTSDFLKLARSVAEAWMAQLASAIEKQDAPGAAILFREDGYWRDVLAMTRDLRTLSGPAAIAAGLEPWLPVIKTTPFTLEDREPEIYERRGWGWVIEVFFQFSTTDGRGRGHLRLLRTNAAADAGPFDPADPAAGWAGWTLLSVLEELKGFEDPAEGQRPEHGGPQPSHRPDPAGPLDVLVIGAGHAGLTVAARLRQLGLRTLVVEQHPRVGDNWRTRYNSLVLHNQVWANHLPYLPFPENWPVYLDKNQMADWLEHYASLMEIDVVTSTRFDSGAYDEEARHWLATLAGADGTTRTVTPGHIVLATGVFGPAHRPELPGLAEFTGEVTYSTSYGRGERRGRRVLVVGSGSSAHDIAQDLHENGAEVTMLQRSSTTVVSLDPGAARAYAIYRQDGLPVEDCDLIMNSFSLPLLAQVHQDLTRSIAAMDVDLLAGLESAGFAIDFGEDGSGFLLKYLRRGGGYYINVGCSDLIISGEIAVKQGTEISGLSGRSVTFADGSSLQADEIVLAVGFDNMSETVRALFGDGTAERVGPVWGLDDEGELRAMWRPTGQPHLWIMGGSLQQCRPYSKYLALQIKAQEEQLWI